MAKAKKRNPTDATLRNIRALKHRVERLEFIVGLLSKVLPKKVIKDLSK